MELDKYIYYYFLGIGGIGMSALARYFRIHDKKVAGYDRTNSELIQELVQEGIEVTHTDHPDFLPKEIIYNPDEVLIIFTPAIPIDSALFQYFLNRGYKMAKRAEVLGYIFSKGKGIAVAGTHGKTTTSTMVAHLFKQSTLGCSAFLGGISVNYNTNLLLSKNSEIIIAEADEYDRSFLQLSPSLAAITSIEPDHLDIYNNFEEIIAAFESFIKKIKPNGTLIYHKKIKANVYCNNNITTFSYSANEKADFYPFNLRTDGQYQLFDLQTPQKVIPQMLLPLPGKMNLENATVACALALLGGVEENTLREALACFNGVKRRFEYYINHENIKLIDDYAHHPTEIEACFHTARSIYPGYKITGIFQPHLYSRTRDFAQDFANALNLFDEIVLLDIYPAREKPIEGVSSEIIFNKISNPNKYLTQKNELLKLLENLSLQVVIMMGAGDINQLLISVKNLLTHNYIIAQK